jgi:hypothetical protein
MSQSDYTLTVAELPALRQFFQLQNLLGVGSPDFTDKSILQLMTQLDALSASYPQLSNAKFKGWTDHRAITSSGVEKAGDLINQDEQASPNGRHYRCECVGGMGLSDYRFDHTWRSVNEHLPASSRFCHIGYDALGHLLSCDLAAQPNAALCTRDFHNGLCGHR